MIDSYVGVDFSIVYKVNVTMKRKNESKLLEASTKFDCKVPGGGIIPELGRSFKPQDFSITPDFVDQAGKGAKVPRFNFCG